MSAILTEQQREEIREMQRSRLTGPTFAESANFDPVAMRYPPAQDNGQRNRKTDKPAEGIDKTLDERGARYGKFTGHAEITQRLKSAMRAAPKWSQLAPDQMEALEMVAHKIGRILNGDPNYNDSWHDIAGYSKLVEDRINGAQR